MDMFTVQVVITITENINYLIEGVVTDTFFIC